MNSIKVALSGAFGKMGKILKQQFDNDPDISLKVAFDASDNLKSIFNNDIDVLVDFTVAEAAHSIIYESLSAGVPVISGTTAQNRWFSEYEDLVNKSNTSLAIIPNFSIGAMLLEEFGVVAKKYISDAELIEYHHATKKDKPSGTAKKIASSVGIDNVNIHAVRLPGFLAHHELIFGKSGETLSLRHDTSGRECYFWGIKKAIIKINNDKSPRFYKGLKEMIEI